MNDLIPILIIEPKGNLRKAWYGEEEGRVTFLNDSKLDGITRNDREVSWLKAWSRHNSEVYAHLTYPDFIDEGVAISVGTPEHHVKVDTEVGLLTAIIELVATKNKQVLQILKNNGFAWATTKKKK